jgi:hypothetical protein
MMEKNLISPLSHSSIDPLRGLRDCIRRQNQKPL